MNKQIRGNQSIFGQFHHQFVVPDFAGKGVIRLIDSVDSAQGAHGWIKGQIRPQIRPPLPRGKLFDLG